MFKSMIALAALVLILGSGMAQAQNKLDVNVPFDFYVGKKLMPAGEYRIDQSADGYMALRKSDRSTAAIITTYNAAPVNNDGKGQVVFHRLGNSKFLSEIWDPFSTTVTAVRIPRREREMAQSGNRVETASVVVPILP